MPGTNLSASSHSMVACRLCAEVLPVGRKAAADGGGVGVGGEVSVP